MKHIATVALVLNFGVAGVYAQQRPVKMTFSGTLEATTINLQPDTNPDQENLAGTGTLGRFTFSELHADKASPEPSSSCSSGPYFPTVAGGGVFRFQNGSLLTVTVTEGAYCIDRTARVGHLTETYQITGGTGRFQGASGTLTLTATVIPVLFNASGGAVLLTNTGNFEGTIFGVPINDEGQDERQ